MNVAHQPTRAPLPIVSVVALTWLPKLRGSISLSLSQEALARGIKSHFEWLPRQFWRLSSWVHNGARTQIGTEFRTGLRAWFGGVNDGQSTRNAHKSAPPWHLGEFGLVYIITRARQATGKLVYPKLHMHTMPCTRRSTRALARRLRVLPLCAFPCPEKGSKLT